MVDTDLNNENSGWFLKKKSTFGNRAFVFKRIVLFDLLVICLIIVLTLNHIDIAALFITIFITILMMISVINLYLRYPQFKDSIYIRNEMKIWTIAGAFRMITQVLSVILMWNIEKNEHRLDKIDYIVSIMIIELLNAISILIAQYIIINYVMSCFILPNRLFCVPLPLFNQSIYSLPCIQLLQLDERPQDVANANGNANGNGCGCGLSVPLLFPFYPKLAYANQHDNDADADADAATAICCCKWNIFLALILLDLVIEMDRVKDISRVVLSSSSLSC